MFTKHINWGGYIISSVKNFQQWSFLLWLSFSWFGAWRDRCRRRQTQTRSATRGSTSPSHAITSSSAGRANHGSFRGVRHPGSRTTSCGAPDFFSWVAFNLWSRTDINGALCFFCFFLLAREKWHVLSKAGTLTLILKGLLSPSLKQASWDYLALLVIYH